MKVAAGAVALAGCRGETAEAGVGEVPVSTPLPLVKVEPLGQPPWPTSDPFLFCVYHQDDYPAGDEGMGPQASLANRRLGQDFSGKDGWSMYHGRKVPGFPRHPHRGFETVTIVDRGYLDHSDSLGATARVGPGDVQWMTAGRGICHAEMFPLRSREQENPTEFFQIWMNLPARRKMSEPRFTMFWDHQVPVFTEPGVKVRTVAGAIGQGGVPAPPPDSWASEPGAEVAMWVIDLNPGASWTLPAVGEGVVRSLYFYDGAQLRAGEQDHGVGHRVVLDGHGALPLEARGGQGARLLLLQGRPIGEPVVSHGPFVMNTREEIQTAFSDYRRDQFGGWPWPSDAPVHAREAGRFAVHADGRREEPA